MDSVFNFLDTLLDLAVRLIPLFGIIITWMGLNTWKRQIKGTDKYKVASELLLETFRVREGIQIVRTPLIEYVPIDEEKESEEMKNFLGYVDALEKRWKRLLEPTAQLSLAALKAEVHLGKDVKKSADDLHQLVRELQIAYQMHIEMRRPGSGLEDDKFYIENRKTLWAKPTEDEYNTKVTNTINTIESLLRPYL